MLTVWEAIKKRRSIRKFLPDDVSEEMIEQMLEAARLAPSATNHQPWRFMVVRDKEVKKELCRIRGGQRFIEEAPVVIVCFTDLERYSQEAKRQRWKEFLDSGVAATLSGQSADRELREARLALPTPPREELLVPAISNTFIAIDHLVLMATALGLGTCWVGVSNAVELNRLFGISDNLVPVVLVPVGYPDGEIPPQRPRVDREEILLKPQVQFAGGGARA